MLAECLAIATLTSLAKVSRRQLQQVTCRENFLHRIFEAAYQNRASIRGPGQIPEFDITRLDPIALRTGMVEVRQRRATVVAVDWREARAGRP